MVGSLSGNHTISIKSTLGSITRKTLETDFELTFSAVSTTNLLQHVKFVPNPVPNSLDLSQSQVLPRFIDLPQSDIGKVEIFDISGALIKIFVKILMMTSF